MDAQKVFRFKNHIANRGLNRKALYIHAGAEIEKGILFSIVLHLFAIFYYRDCCE